MEGARSPAAIPGQWSPCISRWESPSPIPVILLVRINPDDPGPRATGPAVRCTEVVLARDGVEALDYLFGSGDHATETRRSCRSCPPDLEIPQKSGGLKC